MARTDTVWTVWVGGTEVNDYHMAKDKALSLASYWKDRGYNDVKVQGKEEDNNGKD
jgi:hypothetical protein